MDKRIEINVRVVATSRECARCGKHNAVDVTVGGKTIEAPMCAECLMFYLKADRDAEKQRRV